MAQRQREAEEHGTAGTELAASGGPVQICVAAEEEDEEEEGAQCPAARGGGSCSEEDSGRCGRSR